MDQPGIPSPSRTRRENQLQGPRPSPLRVSKDSHQIRKPPIAPRLPPRHAQPQQLVGNQPLIIYSVSPKPIHVEASNFMSIVQRLTGKDSSSSPEPSFPHLGDAPISPAARLAAIERASPTEREKRERWRGDVGDEILVGMMAEEREGEGMMGIEVGQMPGILSPAPSNLPDITPGMFSPAAIDGQSLFGASDWMMSPFMGSSNSFFPSPSAMIFNAGPIVSPTPSPGGDLFSIFDFP